MSREHSAFLRTLSRASPRSLTDHEPISQAHLRVLETFAVQDDFRDERVVRDHHRHRAEAGLMRSTG